MQYPAGVNREDGVRKRHSNVASIFSDTLYEQKYVDTSLCIEVSWIVHGL